MSLFRNKADVLAIESEMGWSERDVPKTIYGALNRVKDRFGALNAVSYQLESGPAKDAETQTWNALHADVTKAANLFRSLGVGEKDVVAFIMPNCTETVHALLGGMVAGIVCPINPLLEPEQIAAILRETGAKVVVALRSFPKAEVAQKTNKALELAPSVETLIEVDLMRYIKPPKSWIAGFLRPKFEISHRAKVLNWKTEMAGQSSELAFEDSTEDRVAAYFHTGGTTGMPKVAQHTFSGMIYNGWIGDTILFSENDNVMCPLPLFHVFAVHVILMAMITSGAHVVFPTPAGYRGDGVFDNFWKLIERWQISFIIAVPTAMSALMQRPVDADISSVKKAFSGSAPVPMELFNKFETATGVEVIEGYGLTEATCLVSCNPVEGEKRVGSVGVPFPYTDVKILTATADGPRECATDEIGEICVSNPGVYAGNTYTAPKKNVDLYHFDKYLRTGDLGRIDAEGYVWITGRAKDLIIRGGHNIDPALIEEALAAHPAVAMAGAIGQPDAHSGELPDAYVELVAGAEVSEADLVAYCAENIPERAAHPKQVTILDELPKTAVGKVFKPDLRKMAITRVYNGALEAAGNPARVVEIVEDKRLGLLAIVEGNGAGEAAIAAVLNTFTRPWKLAVEDA